MVRGGGRKRLMIVAFGLRSPATGCGLYERKVNEVLRA